ncbi:hypothetical protein TELCIR_05502, partial [Teladorsagia circumcincta]
MLTPANVEQLHDKARSSAAKTTQQEIEELGWPVAVKTEKYSKSMLHIEVGVLKAANAAKAKHFCELIDYLFLRSQRIAWLWNFILSASGGSPGGDRSAASSLALDVYCEGAELVLLTWVSWQLHPQLQSSTGSNKPEYVYVVMTLLFKDLHKLRSEMHERKFSLSTSIRLSMQSLR